MPQKARPIFHKLSNLVRTSILLAKMRKRPLIPRLFFIKKKTRELKRFKRLNYYRNYGLVEEFEFSPSTPLIPYYHKQKYFKSYRSLGCKNLSFSVVKSSLCRCLGGGVEVDRRQLSLDALQHGAIAGECLELSLDSGHDYEEDEDSVDQRAERFIQWFYQEMRLQRQESI